MAIVSDRECESCGGTMRIEQPDCPHCGHHHSPPNVFLASRKEEAEALRERYEAAINAARADGSEAALKAFEDTVANDSRAVVHMPFDEAFRLAASDRNLYSTYYKRADAELRLPDDDVWDSLRRHADDAFFKGFGDEIRFACLSLTGIGLPNYGDVAIQLKESHIGERATVFEDNTVVFLRKLNPSFEGLADLPEGHRAKWKDRGRLAVVKHQPEIQKSTPRDEYATVLVKQGSDSGKDEFVEVHIYGPFSVNAFELVTALKWPEGESRSKRFCEFLQSREVELVEPS